VEGIVARDLKEEEKEEEEIKECDFYLRAVKDECLKNYFLAR